MLIIPCEASIFCDIDMNICGHCLEIHEYMLCCFAAVSKIVMCDFAMVSSVIVM
jgi:hypothetical protein